MMFESALVFSKPLVPSSVRFDFHHPAMRDNLAHIAYSLDVVDIARLKTTGKQGVVDAELFYKILQDMYFRKIALYEGKTAEECFKNTLQDILQKIKKEGIRISIKNFTEAAKGKIDALLKEGHPFSKEEQEWLWAIYYSYHAEKFSKEDTLSDIFPHLIRLLSWLQEREKIKSILGSQPVYQKDPDDSFFDLSKALMEAVFCFIHEAKDPLMVQFLLEYIKTHLIESEKHWVLTQAALLGDFATFKILFEGFTVDWSQIQGDCFAECFEINLLYGAVCANSFEIVEYLLEHEEEGEREALFAAARSNNDILRLLLKKGQCFIDDTGDVLFEALEQENIAVVEIFLESKKEELFEITGNYMLGWAAKVGDFAMVKAVLEHTSLEISLDTQEEAFKWDDENGRFVMAELLAKEPTVHLNVKCLIMPLYFSLKYKHFDVVHYLFNSLERIGEIANDSTYLFKRERTFLWAERDNYLEVVKVALDALGLAIPAEAKNKAFVWVTQYGYTEIVKVVFEPVVIEICDRYQYKGAVLSSAAEYGYKEVVALLLEHLPADVCNIVKSDAVYAAMRKGMFSVIELLLQHLGEENAVKDIEGLLLGYFAKNEDALKLLFEQIGMLSIKIDMFFSRILNENDVALKFLCDSLKTDLYEEDKKAIIAKAPFDVQSSIENLLSKYSFKENCQHAALDGIESAPKRRKRGASIN